MTSRLHQVRHGRDRRGLTLLELLLALVITTLVAGAIAGMLGAVSAGVGSRKDNRAVMVLAHAGQSRLAAYFATARCVLARSGSNITLWLNDSRESNTVHASEVRWLQYDSAAGALMVRYVDFPANWTRTACEIADNEYAASSDWDAVLASYQAKNLISSRALVDNLASVSLTLDHASAAAARRVGFLLGFDTEQGVVEVQASGAIRVLMTPAK
jgi:prepilin-type N-terminal cleavage/methylation domain-containing protein